MRMTTLMKDFAFCHALHAINELLRLSFTINPVMKVLKENPLILKLKFNAIKLKVDQAHVEQPEIFHHHIKKVIIFFPPFLIPFHMQYFISSF